MNRTRRQWLRAAVLWPASLALQAGRKEFWKSKDPGSWTNEEKQSLLEASPWAREGFVRMEVDENLRRPPQRDNTSRPPDHRQGLPPGGVPSVPIGEPLPRVPKPDAEPLEFRVMARWETAKPVRLAGGPEAPELTGDFYVIRVRGLPLMPPRKSKPGEAATNPNAGILQAIKEGSRLERKGKAPIACAHLFTGSGDDAGEVLLFFPRGTDPITVADKAVTLESSFAPFHMEVKFALKDMVYKGELAL